MLYLEIGIVVVLICVNGLLAMSELAIVSSRPARLKSMIDRNIKGAGRALALGADPGDALTVRQRFVSCDDASILDAVSRLPVAAFLRF